MRSWWGFKRALHSSFDSLEAIEGNFVAIVEPSGRSEQLLSENCNSVSERFCYSSNGSYLLQYVVRLRKRQRRSPLSSKIGAWDRAWARNLGRHLNFFVDVRDEHPVRTWRGIRHNIATRKVREPLGSSQLCRCSSIDGFDTWQRSHVSKTRNIPLTMWSVISDPSDGILLQESSALGNLVLSKRLRILMRLNSHRLLKASSTAISRKQYRTVVG